MKENKNNLIQIPLSKNRLRHFLALAGLILLLGVGLFGLAGRAQAEVCTDVNSPTGCIMNGYCRSVVADEATPQMHVDIPNISLSACGNQLKTNRINGTWTPNFPSGAPAQSIPFVDTPAGTPGSKTPAPSEFDKWATDESCGIIGDSSVSGCIKAVFYYVVYTPSAVLLSITATFFNALVNLALSNALFSNNFIPTAWAVVRDLSNLFFILILLYIAIKIILDMGGHDAKKMIAKVIVIALLINFSMFFTQVIIDSSNILALVFYNKLDVTYKDPVNGQPKTRPYNGATGTGEKDLSGSMYNGFDVTSKLNGTAFWDGVKGAGNTQVPVGTMVGIIVIASAIMLFAAYAFLVSGIAFVARVIELFVLIIFSPFAFMSSTVPLFSGVEYIGWDSWFKRLLKVAFMAPIFMFFMYLIFSLLNAKLFSSLVTVQTDWKQTLLGVLIPGSMILILLLKATEYAKKGSGVIGEKLMAGAKMIGGLALGAATGGTAFLASNTAGRIGRNIANNDDLKVKAAAGDKGAQRKLTLANSFANKSFDIRQTGLGKLAAKQSGMDFNAGLGAVGLGTENLKGGRKERDKEVVEKHEEKVKSYELSKSESIKHDNRNKQYEEDKKAARAYAVARGADLNEKEFKEDYEKGVAGEKRNYGLNKTVEVGSVKSAKQVNGDRRKAYAYSLEYPNAKIDKNGDITKDENGNVVREKIRKGLGSSFVSGMAGMATNPAGLALAVATAGLAIPLGGLAAVIKDLVKTQAQQRIPLFTEHKEIIAGVRKGVSSEDKLNVMLKKYMQGDSHAGKAIIDDAKKPDDHHEELTHAPAASSTPAHSPTGGEAPTTHHS